MKILFQVEKPDKKDASKPKPGPIANSFEMDVDSITHIPYSHYNNLHSRNYSENLHMIQPVNIFPNNINSNIINSSQNSDPNQNINTTMNNLHKTIQNMHLLRNYFINQIVQCSPRSLERINKKDQN